MCGVLEWGVEGGRRRGYELERLSRRYGSHVALGDSSMAAGDSIEP